jgi:hypothetical protein
MASAEEKWSGESRDRQLMASNANGAEGAEGKAEEANLNGKDTKDPSGEEAALEASVSKGGAGNGRSVEFLGSTQVARPASCGLNLILSQTASFLDASDELRGRS